MNSVEIVKALCKDKKIAISRLERDLGFSNGYIGQLRKGVLPTDRLVLIADYLNVSTDYILTGELDSSDGQKEKPAAPKNDGLDKERAEWITAWENATPEQRKYALAVLTLQVPPAED